MLKIIAAQKQQLAVNVGDEQARAKLLAKSGHRIFASAPLVVANGKVICKHMATPQSSERAKSVEEIGVIVANAAVNEDWGTDTPHDLY